MGRTAVRCILGSLAVAVGMGIGVGEKVFVDEGSKADGSCGFRGDGEGFFKSSLLSLLSRSAEIYHLPTS